MKTKMKIAVAILLGITVVMLTGYASGSTKSTVMISLFTHGVADTTGLTLLLIALVLHAQKKEYPIVGMTASLLLTLAGTVAVGFAVTHLLALSGDRVFPIKNPYDLLGVSIFTFLAVCVQMLLTKSTHHLTHGHDHNLEEMILPFDDNVPIGTSSKMLHMATDSALKELLADLIQSAAGILMGLVVVTLGDVSGVRYLDSVLSLMLGIWMMWRGMISLKK
jgi:Co/Zn/Cd efflux system component